jgi:hypothetical protein
MEAEVPIREVRYLQAGEQGHRARLPLEIYPYSAGVRGGLAGGAAMFVLAVIYGLVYHNSIWYPANLLAAAGSSSIAAMSYEQLRAYNGLGVVLATLIHLTGSVLVGLLYGIALPMIPRRPILFGGVIAPLLWSGLLYSAMGIINPTLAAHVDWFRVCPGPNRIRRGRRPGGGKTFAHLHAAICPRRSTDGPGSSRHFGREAWGGFQVMRASLFSLVSVTTLVLLNCGCGRLPGKPTPAEVPVVPKQVRNFAELYRLNCAGCHGLEGKGNGALALANPVYLTIVSDDNLRRVTAEGVRERSCHRLRKVPVAIWLTRRLKFSSAASAVGPKPMRCKGNSAALCRDRQG